MNTTFSMLKNSSSIIALLITSTFLGVCSSSWLIIWVCLEINTIIMCCLIAQEINNWNLQETPTLMYYLIQVMASIAILVSSYQEESQTITTIIVIALLTNIGAWPMHSWYINLISVIEINQASILVVITWQNIIPVIFVCSLTENINHSLILGILVVLTLIVPLTNLLYTLSIKSILAISSFNNNGWLLAAALTSQAPFWLFLGLYSTTLAVTLNSLNELSNNSISLISSFWLPTLIVSNIGGLPPITIFWANIIVVSSLLPWAPTELALLLILTACYLLYHYLWIMLNEVSHSPINTQNPNSKGKTSNVALIITALSVGGFVVALS